MCELVKIRLVSLEANLGSVNLRVQENTQSSFYDWKVTKPDALPVLIYITKTKASKNAMDLL